MKKNVIIILAAAILLALAVLAYRSFEDDQSSSQRSLIDNDTLAQLPTEDSDTVYTDRLAEEMKAPTNKWFSGIALQEDPQTVHPTPLQFTPTDSSYSASLASARATTNTIFSQPGIPTNFVIAEADRYVISRYDEMSVDLTYYDESDAIGTVTISAGSPFVFFEASVDTQLQIEGDLTYNATENIARASNESTNSSIAVFDGANFSTSDNDITVTAPANSTMVYYSYPDNLDDDLFDNVANNRITGTTVDYQVEGDHAKTSLNYQTENDQPTIVGLMPHHMPEQSNATIDTLYGPMAMVETNAITYQTDRIETKKELPLDSISDEQRELLVTTLQKDIQDTSYTAEDTYFGGKQLYRSAQLLQLAKQLDEQELAQTIQTKLRDELALWLDFSDESEVKSFYYDESLDGIVGLMPAFGSEEFNDHHFHYGYSIYAASILASHDNEFYENYKAEIDILIADIANYNDDEQLPLRRAYDPYFGHSWASGTSPFADGNNQESSSEAINAWIGTSLWAEVSDNLALKEHSQWLLSNEVATTEAYWMNYDQDVPPYNSEFDKSVIALNWGGKRDYATFFSAEPAAMLGIQLIPMSPTTTFQEIYGDRIDRHVREAIDGDDYDIQFGDYILMYESLHSGGEGKLDTAQSLSDETIDGANSRSYLYAWIMSQK